MPIPTEKLTKRFLVMITTDKMPRWHVACRNSTEIGRMHMNNYDDDDDDDDDDYY